MINSATFHPAWLQQLSSRHGRLEVGIVEKMILALTLVERLAQEQVSFVFKGGTCLVLLLGQARRFSVDVDIVTEAPAEELQAALDRLVQQPPFVRVEYDERRSTKDTIPRGHYYLYYTPIVERKRPADHPEPYIALDVLHEAHGYPDLQQVPVTSEFLQVDNPIQRVTVPSAESIAGDKLTAFAPRTTGILYGSEKSLEIIKQLFDVGVLFDEVQQVEIVARAYAATVAKELAYRQLPLTAADVLRDTIQTAYLLAQQRLLNPAKVPDLAAAGELSAGISSFANYLIGERFNLDKAVVAGAKAAYLAARLLVQEYAALPRYAAQPVSDLRLTDPRFNFLNKLRSTPEALFFWQQTVKLLTQHGQEASLLEP